VSKLRSHLHLSQMPSGVSHGPSQLSFYRLTQCLPLVWTDESFIIATKHLRFTLVKVTLLKSVWRVLYWWGRKATISDWQDIKMLQQSILIHSLSCQIPKAQSPEKLYKGALPTGKV
jgi:hypothetical protein